jgi:radical SAM protein with 4Fe4S-binding SPASM domain
VADDDAGPDNHDPSVTVFFGDLEALGATPRPTPAGTAAPADMNTKWQALPQRGTTLGERLGHVFGDLFDLGATGVIAVNSDSPPIPEQYLAEAVELVRTPSAGGRLVIGPAADGGYYLMGTDRETWRAGGDSVRELLRDSPMGTAALLAATLQGAAALRLEVRQLPLWIDVDDARDLPVLERLTGRAPLRGEPLERLREVYLHVTHRCAHGCRHCYNLGRHTERSELSTSEWKDTIDECVSLGASSFVFIGGDPLLRPDLTDLVAHATGRRGTAARFFFNSLIDEGTAEALAEAGHGRLRPLVSIDGPRAVNDGLRGPGNHAEVFASIANLRAAGLDPVANTVLVAPALPGLPQLARELRQAGVGRLHLILPHQRGRVWAAGEDGGISTAGEDGGVWAAGEDGGVSTAGEDGRGHDWGLAPDALDLLDAIDRLTVVADDIGLVIDNLPSWRQRVGARNDFCASGCRDLAIDPSGHVHACAITVGDPAFVAGDLRREPLERIWRGSPSFRLLRASSARDRAECRACAVVDACGGECWVQAHYAARGANEPAGYRAAFPYCDFVRPVLERLGAGEAARRSTVVAAGERRPPAPTTGRAAAGACGGQAAAGEAAYSLFDCI